MTEGGCTTTDYGTGILYRPPFNVWQPLPWHKWIKRLRGYRWEKWVDALGEWELIYGTDERVAKDYLDKEFG